MKKLKRIKKLINGIFCEHSRTFEFYPDNVNWSRNGINKGKFNHGAKVTGCMDCGKTWVSDYAE